MSSPTTDQPFRQETEYFMCGIAGESGVGNSPECHSEAMLEVRRMVASLHHRGPDGNGFRTGEGAVLGASRLAIVDVAGGNQPISTPDGRYHIVYNGECYNADELRGELQARGADFRTHADTEVVLWNHIVHGPDGLHRLNGMFAFAIWDSQQRELFVARDRVGIKPLFYWQNGRRLVFSSTLNAIQARTDFEGTIDNESIELYLATKFILAPRTIFREIRKLPAGHWLRWKQGEVLVRQWWDFPLENQHSLVIDHAKAESHVEELLRTASRCRLMGERPVGLCLSGGIDSGLIAAGLRNDNVRTYSLGFDDSRFDESAAAAHVADHLGLAHRRLLCQPNAIEDLRETTQHYGEPVGDSSAIALFNLARQMSQHVTVAISGTGGDELFGGYQRYVAARLARMTRYLPGLGGVAGLLGRDESKRGWRKQLGRFARAASVSPLECYLRLLCPTDHRVLATMRQPDFAASLGGFSPTDVFRDHFDRARGHSLLTRLMYLDAKTVLVDDYLVKDDRMTMAHSLEGRVPFLDHRLIDYAYRLPDAMKIGVLETKRLLRSVARRQLPRKIASSPKQGFDLPLAETLRGPLSAVVNVLLLSSQARITDYVRPAVIQRIIADHSSGTADHSRLVWSLLVLELWMQEFQRPTLSDASP